MGWANYVALGDSLTAGRDDHGPEGARIGWARRLAGILTARTSVRCALTNLAADGASAGVVLERQLPSVAGLGPDLVSVTVGMNDIRDPGFTPERFAAELGLLLDGVAVTGATVLTCTLPDIAAIMPLPAHLVEVARERMRQASDIIRKQAAERDVRLPGRVGDARGGRPGTVRAGPDPPERQRASAHGGLVRRLAADGLGCGRVSRGCRVDRGYGPQ